MEDAEVPFQAELHEAAVGRSCHLPRVSLLTSLSTSQLLLLWVNCQWAPVLCEHGPGKSVLMRWMYDWYCPAFPMP